MKSVRLGGGELHGGVRRRSVPHGTKKSGQAYDTPCFVLRLRPHRRPAITDAKGIPDVAHVEGVVVVALDGGLARADSAPREVYQVLRLEYTLTPDLHYQTVKGALLLSPSPPRIAPSQLRLVDAG